MLTDEQRLHVRAVIAAWRDLGRYDLANGWAERLAEAEPACSVCGAPRKPGARWCDEHAPVFLEEPARAPPPRSPGCRARLAIQAHPDWTNEALAERAGCSVETVKLHRRDLGIRPPYRATRRARRAA